MTVHVAYSPISCLQLLLSPDVRSVAVYGTGPDIIGRTNTLVFEVEPVRLYILWSQKFCGGQVIVLALQSPVQLSDASLLSVMMNESTHCLPLSSMFIFTLRSDSGRSLDGGGNHIETPRSTCIIRNNNY